jgi:hypothetical protein
MPRSFSHLLFAPCTDFSSAQLSADLALFPTESHAVTASRLIALQRTVAGPTCSARKTRMLRNRVLHYFWFAIDMKWTDDLTGAKLPR